MSQEFATAMDMKRTVLTLHAPNTIFQRCILRIDSVLGRTHCRGCQMPEFVFMQANYLNDVGL